ncbi:GHKL domain-containing protein [Anaeromicropila populeti]|uniref:GHKL domain-containing protein n=1 Tax=Anaeromicropila populeti TaxID=37658 RepID=A0A1I6LF63_9FIRM|nr:GHKL domain-containing protein [Anaeromicropila populeti]SFS02111.1 GHKL domain-containing protein [Anaeromicropila populeti]
MHNQKVFIIVMYVAIIVIQVIINAVIAGYSCLTLYKKNQRHVKDNETIDFIKAQLTMYNNISNSTNELQNIKNQWKAHLCNMQLLLKEKKFEEATAYIEKLMPDALLENQIYELENTILAVVIYEKKIRAEEKSIQVEFNLEVKDLPLTAGEINGVVGNILNNAIDACEQIEDIKQRYIRFETFEKKGKIYIVCRNSISMFSETVKKGYLGKNKMNIINNDFQIKVANNIIERNNGEMQIRFNQNEFVIKAIIDNLFEMRV